MKRLLSIIFIGSLLIATYLSLATLLSKTGLIIVWTAVFLIIMAEIFVLYLQKKETRQEYNWNYYEKLWLKQKPRGLGLPEPYINGLPQNPSIKHAFKAGQKYEKASKYQDAINEYDKCLSQPQATPSNKVASNLLIGNCYFDLSKLDLAEKHYKEAIKISKQVEDKQEMLRGESIALSNIGLVYRAKEDFHEALRYHREAIEIHKEIGYRQGEAEQLGNIGLIYLDKGDTDEAMKYLKKAVEIDKIIGYRFMDGI